MQDTPIRLILNGRHVWRFEDGTVIPVVSGGSDDEPGNSGGGLSVETPPSPPAPSGGGPTGGLSPEEFERRLNEERERVRKEEKDKLYEEQKRLKDQLKDFERKEKERTDAEAAAQAEQERLRREAEEAELSAKEITERRFNELQEQIKTIEQERDRDRALLEREREFSRVMEYRSKRVQEEINADRLPAEFAEFVTGGTEEDVEASIIKVEAKAEEVWNSVSQAFGRNLPPEEEQLRTIPPRPFTGAPPADPLGDPERTRRTYTAQELRDMPMEEYIKNRPALLEATRGSYYGTRGN